MSEDAHGSDVPGEAVEGDGSGDPTDGTTFERELSDARALLDAEDVTAVHVGVVRGEAVDTAFAQTGDTPEEEGLRALTLLATHLRLVADEADVDYETVAVDAARLAGSVEELPDVEADSGNGSDVVN